MSRPLTLLPQRTGRALRPTFEELCQNTRLLHQTVLVAGFSILFSSAFARVVLGIESPAFSPLLIVGLNSCWPTTSCCRLCVTTTTKRPACPAGRLGTDSPGLAGDGALVHFTGGSPAQALIYFVVHAALSGTILLPGRRASLTLLAIVSVGAWPAGGVRAGWRMSRLENSAWKAICIRTRLIVLAVMVLFGSTVLICLNW